MQTEHTDEYRVWCWGTIGRMSPYGVQDTLEDAQRLHDQIYAQQAASPFVSTPNVWIEKNGERVA